MLHDSKFSSLLYCREADQIPKVCDLDAYGEVKVVDGLIRDCPKVDRIYPALATINQVCQNAFFINVNISCTPLAAKKFVRYITSGDK